jgi:pectin methylesterase-like acyl-CoA thioesterase
MRGLSYVLVSMAVAGIPGCGGGNRASTGTGTGTGTGTDAAGAGGADARGDPDAGVDAPAAGDAPPVIPLQHVTSVFPARDATGVCTDAPLRLFFDTPPALGTSGWVKVFDAANPTTPVDSFDLAGTPTVQKIGGRNYLYKPIVISGNEAYFYLRKVLQPGGTYYVTIDPGVFTGGAGGPPIGAAADATTWRFTIRSAAPAAGASRVVVAADGAGDFCTVQGAVDYVPAANTAPVTIQVAPGTYREIVAIQTKHAITLRGQDRNASVISYPNNAALQILPGTTTSMGTKWRAMVGVDTSDDFVLENITLWNPSPQLSSNGQSEALRVEGGLRTIVRNATIRGLQDTLLMSGQIYVANSIIEGNVDFVWGNGTVYFDSSEIKVVARKGYTVQARNGASAAGYVFVGCNLTADDGIMGHVLARTDKNTTSPASMVAYIGCTMGPHIDPAGWLIDGYQRPAADAGASDGGAPDGGVHWNLANLRFWEHHSVDPAGTPIDVSRRIPESKQLSDAEAAQLRDVTYVFNGWDPKAASGDGGVD